MKRLLLIILVLVIVSPVLGADINASTYHIPSEEQLRGIIREFPEPPQVPVPTEAPVVEVSYTPLSQDIISQIIDTIKKIIIPDTKEKKQTINDLVNATPESVINKPQVVVAIKGQDEALISLNSELNGKELHEFCVRFGYGTDEWRQCERSMT